MSVKHGIFGIIMVLVIGAAYTTGGLVLFLLCRWFWRLVVGG